MGLSSPRKKDFPSVQQNYKVEIPSEPQLILCGRQRPIFTTKNTRWPPAQYSRHVACENGQLGGDQGTAPACERQGTGIGQHRLGEQELSSKGLWTGIG